MTIKILLCTYKEYNTENSDLTGRNKKKKTI